MNSRLIKILFSGAVGVYISLVCFNNVFDYNSNFPFVRMVANMEDTFSKERNGWRAINSVSWHHILFILIVIWELSIAFLVWLGFFRMISKLRLSAIEFKQAKKYTSLGMALGVLLWFTAFITIGGEWFLMWQSKTWNAQSTAFFLTCCFLLFLIHHNQEDI
jgi:predicted small integral membrane protein